MTARNNGDPRVLTVHKEYTDAVGKLASPVKKLANKMISDNEKDIDCIVSKLKSIKKKVRDMPTPSEKRLIDIDDPFATTSWYSQMEDLTLIGEEREARRRSRRSI